MFFFFFATDKTQDRSGFSNTHPSQKAWWKICSANREQVNPRPTGGGGYFEPPLSFSCDIFKTSAGITAKLAVPSLPTFLHIVLKF